MRVLLDESIPRRLKYELAGHDVVTVTEQGWRSILESLATIQPGQAIRVSALDPTTDR